MTEFREFRKSQRPFPEFWDLAARSLRFHVMSLADMARTLPGDPKTIRKEMKALGFPEIGRPSQVLYRLEDARLYAMRLAHPKPIVPWSELESGG